MDVNGRTLLSIDVGTTHCKAALFSEQGRLLRIAKAKTVSYAEKGWTFYDPEQLWDGIVRLIRQVADPENDCNASAIAAIGITSMAETGLMVDTASGEARTPLIPWFSRCAVPQSELISAEGNSLDRFAAAGLHASFKFGLAKLLWLKESSPESLQGAVWLSASDFVAYRLTRVMATDYTLAARTFAFRIDSKQWDNDWIRHFNLNPGIFPTAAPSGTVVGGIHADVSSAVGLPAGIPVAIAGHDHVAASLAAGVVNPGQVMDSMGTAETLVGLLAERKLSEEDRASKLAFGCHPVSGRYFWMGGLSSSGGSVEWFRSVLSEPELTYERLLQLLSETEESKKPTGILYFPYLSGSGAPLPDARAKGAFVGLTAEHGQADLLRAVLEGTAFEMEWIRQTGERATGARIEEMIVTGGGTNNPVWLQIKANVTGCSLRQPEQPETALLGAALLAGVGCGLYADAVQAAAIASASVSTRWVYPQENLTAGYKSLFEQGYIPLQSPLRQFYQDFHS